MRLPSGMQPVVQVAPVAYVQLAITAAATAALAYDDGVALALVRAGAVCLALGATVVVHEAGHVLAARFQRLAVYAVVLRGLLDGGTRRQVSRSWRANAVVSLAGPAASAALGAVGVVVALTTSDFYWLGRALALANLFVVLSTLTAGPRSDGVRAWRAWRGSRSSART